MMKYKTGDLVCPSYHPKSLYLKPVVGSLE